jgi:hypothetical protein
MAAWYLIPGGFTDWADVRPRHVQEWTVSLLGAPYSSNDSRALQQFFNWHAAEGPEA